MNAQTAEPNRTEILRARTPTEIEAVRALLREYAAETGLDLCFQGFETELATLPGDYSAPQGCLLLARCESQWAGCVALRPLRDVEQPGCCEMKRLFVSDRFRGRGVGRALVTSVIEAARDIGYTYMKLDTLESLTASNALYRALGFESIAPYRHNPFPDARFFGFSLI